jgi:hypothetical protein
VGSISTTATATAYSTSSDIRLKTAITPITGALDVLRQIPARTWRWRSDNSRGVGFVANEIQHLVPEAITGEPDAVDESGNIMPQQMDSSKLLPYVIASMQEMLTMIEELQHA